MKKFSDAQWVVLFLAGWGLVDIIVGIADLVRGY